MIETINKTVSSVTDALKGSPVVLALVLLNVIFLGAATYGGYRQDQLFHEMVKYCFEKGTKQ